MSEVDVRGGDERYRIPGMEPTALAAASASRRAPTHDADVELHLTFAEAALGTTATVHVDTATPCSACSGTGAARRAGCTACAGAGFHTRTSGGINIRTECRTCAGAGRADATPCASCTGAGSVGVTRAVTIRVPPGVADGARLRFSIPERRDRTHRHAVVRVAPHPYFQREGNDLKIRVPITIAEAALGADVIVPTLGGAVAIRIPPATSGGRTFRIRGRGIPGPSGAGDLLATVDVTFPREPSDAQRQALEAFDAVTPSPRQHFTSSPRSDTTDAPDA